MGFFSKKKKEAVIEKTEEEIIKEKFQVISDAAKIEKDEKIGTLFQNPYSIVCFVNDDMPHERQVIHVAEVIADFVLHFSNKHELQTWNNHQKVTGKKDKIICFRVSAADMNVLYGDHLQRHRRGQPTPFKSLSTILYQGTAFPVAFCLGVIEASRIPEEYYVYPYYTM